MLLKSFFNKLAVTIIISLTAFCFFQRQRIKTLDNSLGQVTNNYKYYQELNSKLKENNRTLQLTIGELNNSKDSLIRT